MAKKVTKKALKKEVHFPTIHKESVSSRSVPFSVRRAVPMKSIAKSNARIMNYVNSLDTNDKAYLLGLLISPNTNYKLVVDIFRYKKV